MANIPLKNKVTKFELEDAEFVNTEGQLVQYQRLVIGVMINGNEELIYPKLERAQKMLLKVGQDLGEKSLFGSES